MPKNGRLLNKADFERVFEKARPFRDRGFTLLVRNNGLLTARIGFIIAKKKVRLSVDRNRIRRVTKESFRSWRAQLPHIDMIFIGQAGLAAKPNSELFASLEKQWSRIISTMAE